MRLEALIAPYFRSVPRARCRQRQVCAWTEFHGGVALASCCRGHSIPTTTSIVFDRELRRSLRILRGRRCLTAGALYCDTAQSTWRRIYWIISFGMEVMPIRSKPEDRKSDTAFSRLHRRLFSRHDRKPSVRILEPGDFSPYALADLGSGYGTDPSIGRQDKPVLTVAATLQ